jgi:hypothetical protein
MSSGDNNHTTTNNHNTSLETNDVDPLLLEWARHWSSGAKRRANWIADLAEPSTEESKNESSTGPRPLGPDFKPQDHDIVFKAKDRTKKTGHQLMKKVVLKYLSRQKFEKYKASTIMREDAPALMKAIIDLVGANQSNPPSMYKLEEDKNGQVRYIDANPLHMVTYVQHLRKVMLKRAKASNNVRRTTATTTPSSSSSPFISELLATRLAQQDAPHCSSQAVVPSDLLPTPGTTSPTNSLATLPRDYLRKLKIDNLKHDDDKAETELFQDFLSGLIRIIDGNAAFQERIPEKGMLQCLYKGIQMTLDEMLELYEDFETRKVSSRPAEAA